MLSAFMASTIAEPSTRPGRGRTTRPNTPTVALTTGSVKSMGAQIAPLAFPIFEF